MHTTATAFGDLTVKTTDWVTVVNPCAENVIRSFVPSAAFECINSEATAVSVCPGGIHALIKCTTIHGKNINT